MRTKTAMGSKREVKAWRGYVETGGAMGVRRAILRDARNVFIAQRRSLLMLLTNIVVSFYIVF